jgi:hypothetical protein
MTWPFNILRCLHIWKPKGRDWGFDLLTATAMRVANRQGGYQPVDLEKLVTALAKLGFPKWLFGTIDDEDRDAWRIFMRSTIDNVFDFLKQVNVAVLSVYTALVLIAAIRMRFVGKSGLACLVGSIVRIMIVYGTVLGLMLYILDGVRTSPWAKGIASGRTLMRPFPNATLIWRDDDPAVSKGPTTLPVREDVLIGTRLNTRTVGAYRRWNDFHPGNAMFEDHVFWFGGPQYRSYERGLPEVFAERLIDDAFDLIRGTGGRFLQQDYRTGDWRWMDMTETKQHIRLMMLIGYGSLLDELKDVLDLMMDEFRYVLFRTTALSHVSQSYIMDLEAKLFGSKAETANESPSPPPPPPTIRLPVRLALLTNTVKSSVAETSCKRWTTFPQAEIPEIYLHTEVLCRIEKFVLLPATVVGVSREDDTFDIAFYGEDTYEYGSIKSGVKRHELLKVKPPVEGDRVSANFKEEDDWFPGQLTRVRASGRADVQYDDGDFESSVTFRNYFPLGDFEAEFADFAGFF